MEKRNKSIAVLITSHNRKNETLDCLQKLTEQKKLNLINIQIFLVDDGSTDGTSESIVKKFPLINIIHSNGDLFWNRGMHLAWKTACETNIFDYFLWLNDDTKLKDNALFEMLKISMIFQESIIVGTTCSKKDENLITYGGFNKEKKLIIPNNEPVECFFFNGNCVLIPNKIYKQIGILDPYFHHTRGDFEYGYRAQKNKIKSYVVPIIGNCEFNESEIMWLSPQLTAFERLKSLYSPKGNNPFEAFHFSFRYESYIKALLVFIYLNIKAMFPLVFKTYSKKI